MLVNDPILIEEGPQYLSLLMKSCETLLNDGVIIFPTDTVMALACLSTSQKALERMYAIKQRDTTKPIAIFVKEVTQISEIAKTDHTQFSLLAKKFMPGPLTMILPSLTRNETIGIRIPNHKFSLDLLNFISLPIAATSVNLSGENPACNLSEINPIIASKVDMILYEKSSQSKNIASTIISLVQEEIEIIREGVITKDLLWK